MLRRLASFEAAGAGDLSFVAKPALAKLLSSAKASAYIVGPALAGQVPNGIEVAEPYVAYAKVSRLFEVCPQIPKGVHPTAVVDPSAVVAENAAVGPFCGGGCAGADRRRRAVGRGCTDWCAQLCG